MPRGAFCRDDARRLRRESTAAEKLLWSHLRARRFESVKFRRQAPIGPFIVDFCAPARRLVVELDGAQHLDCADADAHRTEYIAARGYRVLRFWNNEVTEGIDFVLDRIRECL